MLKYSKHWFEISALAIDKYEVAPLHFSANFLFLYWDSDLVLYFQHGLGADVLIWAGSHQLTAYFISFVLLPLWLWAEEEEDMWAPPQASSMWSSAREKAFSSFPLFRLPSYHHLLLLRCTLYNDRSRQIAMQLSNSIQQYGSSSITIIFDAVLLTFQGIPHSLFELVSSGLSFSYHLTNLSCISFALSLSLFYSRIIPIARWLVFSACVVLSTTTSCLFALFSFGW